MDARPTPDRSRASGVPLTAEGRLLLEERLRVLDATVRELRGVLDEPKRTAESVAALVQASRELDRLQKVLRGAHSVEHLPDDPHLVELGDTVTIRLESGETRTYLIVHAAEAADEARRLSVESPLGAALIDRRIGQTVRVSSPREAYTCTVLTARRADPARS